MPNYNYELVNWNKYSELSLKGTIREYIDNDWDYYHAIQIHAGRVVIIFRREQQG